MMTTMIPSVEIQRQTYEPRKNQRRERIKLAFDIKECKLHNYTCFVRYSKNVRNMVEEKHAMCVCVCGIEHCNDFVCFLH